MRKLNRFLTTLIAAAAPFAIACAPDSDNSADATAFVDAETAPESKEDTGYVTSLNAKEVELTLEGDATSVGEPLEIGQFALTYLRKNNDVYIQSWAEDYAHGGDQVEWLIDGTWQHTADVTFANRAKMKHFRLAGVSAMVMNAPTATTLAKKTYAPVVPAQVSGLYSRVADKCGEAEGDIDVDQDVYWYVWNPSKAGCNAQTQTLSVKVTKVMASGGTRYPEYDRLIADKKIDALVIFGQVDHGTLSDSDYGFTLVRNFETSLKNASFTKVAATVGLRYQRQKAGLTETIDIYTPREFGGLGDYAHFSNFDKGINSHEIVVYNGHSMLGASDFWARSSIYADPSKYQIFIYNGCLGYEYYVNPIMAGKQGAANVDIVSNVLETPFSIMVQESSSAIAKIMYGAENKGRTSWQSILTRMNTISGSDAFYGASGVRTNTFKP